MGTITTGEAASFLEKFSGDSTTGLLIANGGPWGTVPELLFEKKGLIPAVQQLLVSQSDRHP
jgi:hypothetical protein